METLEMKNEKIYIQLKIIRKIGKINNNTITKNYNKRNTNKKNMYKNSIRTFKISNAENLERLVIGLFSRTSWTPGVNNSPGDALVRDRLFVYYSIAYITVTLHNLQGVPLAAK